ncbi:hypothetical protein [Pseudocnuella soli]|uniref:hypothetical protein n=1 Tax=Pseudocnuella soli TaxID=2502779 RepID=UPI001404F78E|nr:hypothetical protein [Pseudocnuella soli]
MKLLLVVLALRQLLLLLRASAAASEEKSIGQASLWMLAVFENTIHTNILWNKHSNKKQ